MRYVEYLAQRQEFRVERRFKFGAYSVVLSLTMLEHYGPPCPRQHAPERCCSDMQTMNRNGGKFRSTTKFSTKETAPTVPGACWLKDVVQTMSCRQRTVTEACSSLVKLSTEEHHQTFRVLVDSKTLSRHAGGGP